MNRSLQIQSVISELPNSTGIYQFFDKNDRILYVGKAKNIRKRVASYLTKKHESPKTSLLVSKIKNIKYFVVPT